MGKEFIYYSGISIKEGLDISGKNLTTKRKVKNVLNAASCLLVKTLITIIKFAMNVTKLYQQLK